MTTFEQVAEILVDQLGVELEQVTPEARIQEDLEADSLAVMEVVMEAEEQFGVEIPEEELMNIKTVQNIVDFIEANK
ncbi:MAG: acyl carrier protein [Culicoidibacterales bacterium]